MSNDKGKIIAGLFIFLVFAALPVWWNFASGKGAKAPTPERPAAKFGNKCVESTEYMKWNHMDLLDRWRDAAVRDSRRVYIAKDGSKHRISLTHTCLSCHENKAAFCDRCHNYAGVAPYCWDCHVESAKGGK